MDETIKQALDQTPHVLSSTSVSELLSHLETLDLGLAEAMTLENTLQTKMNLLRNEMGEAKLQRKKLESAHESCRRNLYYLRQAEKGVH